MAEEKKLDKELKKEELTDEQVDEAAGGIAGRSFTCSGCRHTYSGSGFNVGGKVYCANCRPISTFV